MNTRMLTFDQLASQAIKLPRAQQLQLVARVISALEQSESPSNATNALFDDPNFADEKLSETELTRRNQTDAALIEHRLAEPKISLTAYRTRRTSRAKGK